MCTSEFCATVWYIFPKIHRTQLSLFTTFQVFFFQFIFVLPARYTRMRNFTRKSKQRKPSKATLEAQHMKKLAITEAKLKKSVAYKKACR